MKQLSVSDAPEVSKIIFELTTPGSPRWSVQQVEEALETSFSLALRDSGRISAFLIYQKVAIDTFEIVYLASAPAFQRKGFMSRLFQEFLKALHTAVKPPFEIWLEVHEKNQAAILFYKKQGFTKTGHRPKYYQDGDSAELFSLRIF